MVHLFLSGGGELAVFLDVLLLGGSKLQEDNIRWNFIKHRKTICRYSEALADFKNIIASSTTDILRIERRVLYGMPIFVAKSFNEPLSEIRDLK